MEKLDAGDEDAVARYQRAMKVKMVTGKGYFFFVDKVNRANPPMYAEHGLKVKASNLCTEITLHSDEFHTFTCVLSSMNLSKYDEWKDTEAVQTAIIFLDCVAEEFIQQGRGIKGLERAVRFTESGRALGLGTLGFHTYLQQNMIDIESFEAHNLNQLIFKGIKQEAVKASKWLAKEKGEPKWCKGHGVRNTHLLAVAPNSSSALICGSVSQGIEPVYKNVFVQGSPAGEINRINPVLVDLMKSKGVYSDETINAIIKDNGSVQLVDWLTDEEKAVFKTSFEINQEVLVRLASARQRYICQAQSLNLFFPSDTPEEEISRVHKLAFKDKYIKSLYYLRSEAGVRGSSGECIACEG
jgi:ribonucleoside-diphosphate reductase alpha chain